MKKTIIIILTLILILTNFTYAETLDESDIIAEAAILIDYDTGQVLFNKNADMKLYPASTTKILTALIILENHDLTEVVTIDKISPHIDGKRIYVIQGEELTVNQLLVATLVESANDAATALAIYHSGSEEAFAEVMNAKAKEIGCTGSNFANAHGLHDPNHYTTASDLALIGQYAMKIPKFREYVKMTKYTIPETEKQDARPYIRNTNAFLGAKNAKKMLYRGENILIEYDIVDGIKTGWTDEAQLCLVSSAEIEGQRYIAVVLKAPNEDQLYIDSRTLIDYGFENFIQHTFNTKGAYIDTLTLTNVENLTVNAIAAESLTKMIDGTIDVSQIERQVHVSVELKAPIEEGQVLGTIVYNYNNIELGSVPMVSEYAVSDDVLLSESEFSIIKKDENNQVDIMFYFNILIKLLISFIIYRAIMTAIALRKRKQRLKQ